jgi:hypothetical protein
MTLQLDVSTTFIRPSSESGGAGVTLPYWPVGAAMTAPSAARTRDWPDKLARKIGRAIGHFIVLWTNSVLRVERDVRQLQGQR